jgi:hypothetical protein
MRRLIAYGFAPVAAPRSTLGPDRVADIIIAACLSRAKPPQFSLELI